MGIITVNPEDLEKAQVICTMQAEHLQAIREFLANYCEVDGKGEIGWLLQPFVGIYRQARTDAEGGFTSAKGAADKIAENLEGTVEEYETTEANATESLNDILRDQSIDSCPVPATLGNEASAPEVLGGHDPVVPGWVKGASGWVSEASGLVTKPGKLYNAGGKLIGWNGESYTPELRRWIDSSSVNPKAYVKAGSTWIADRWQQRAADKMGRSLEDYRTIRVENREDRFYRGYDTAVGGAETLGIVDRGDVGPMTNVINKENFQIVSRGIDDVGQAASLVTGVVDVVNQGDKMVAAVQRNGRVQDVANGGGYGDPSLAAMGITPPSTPQEIEDPTPAISIVPTSQEGDIGDSLRWKAGLLLGGLDWLISQIMDPGPIEQLVKPFAGDWHALDKARQCWGQAGVAVTSVGRNFEGLPAMLGSWQDEGKDAFADSIKDFSDKMYDFSDGCYAMSDVTAALIELGKVVADFIASILGVIGDWLTRLAIEAAIPVVGWIGGAIDVAATATQMAIQINAGLQMMKRFLDMIDKVMKIIKVINTIISVIKTIEKTITAMANIRTAASASAATGTAFAMD